MKPVQVPADESNQNMVDDGYIPQSTKNSGFLPAISTISADKWRMGNGEVVMRNS